MYAGLASNCEHLEAEAIYSNEQLLSFDLKSCTVNWRDHVASPQPRSKEVYMLSSPGLLNGCIKSVVADPNRCEVLVCHDMMGNYLEDRFYNSSRKYDDYKFYHWSAVDYFCYFSHNYITIPPCVWINAAHKHGVYVLGTFITEGEKGSQLLHEVLQSTEKVQGTVEAMVKLCSHFCFDGWLLNLECKVEETDMANLFYFVKSLREAVEKTIPSGIVFWYDSVIESGKLEWQNEINEKNIRFSKIVAATLLNYGWNVDNLMKTEQICAKENIQKKRIFVGIDIFGRGQLAKFRTKSTLAQIVKHDFSVGFFAPAWTFETLRNYGYDINQPDGLDNVNEAFLERNDKFWQSIWHLLATHPYNKLPFETDFCLGSGKQRYRHGIPIENRSFFNLSQQSLQPSVPLYGLIERYFGDAFNGGSCLRILKNNSDNRLFICDLIIELGGLVCVYAYKLDNDDNHEHFSYILNLSTSQDLNFKLYLGDNYCLNKRQKFCYSINPIKLENYEPLTKLMSPCEILPKNVPYSGGDNRWHVRYYLAKFDELVWVKDMGVSFTCNTKNNGSSYLGAVFIDQFDISELQFPEESNVPIIKICD